MKRILLSAVVLFFSAAAFSQKGVGTELGFGIDFGVPVGDFGIKSNPGIGGDAKIGYNFTANWAAGFQAGYMAFFTTDKLDDENIGTLSDGFFKVYGRYTTKGRLYFEPALGFSKFSSGRLRDIGGDGFTYAGSIGYYANAAKTFDFSVRYEGTNNSEAIRFVGLRFGYRLISGHSF